MPRKRLPQAVKGKSMAKLLQEVRVEKKLSSAAKCGDSNKIRDGILVRAPDEMLRIAAKWKVLGA